MKIKINATKKGRFRMTFVAGYASQLCECCYVEIENIQGYENLVDILSWIPRELLA